MFGNQKMFGINKMSDDITVTQNGDRLTVTIITRTDDSDVSKTNKQDIYQRLVDTRLGRRLPIKPTKGRIVSKFTFPSSALRVVNEAIGIPNVFTDEKMEEIPEDEIPEDEIPEDEIPEKEIPEEEILEKEDVRTNLSQEIREKLDYLDELLIKIFRESLARIDGIVQYRNRGEPQRLPHNHIIKTLPPAYIKHRALPNYQEGDFFVNFPHTQPQNVHLSALFELLGGINLGQVDLTYEKKNYSMDYLTHEITVGKNKDKFVITSIGQPRNVDGYTLPHKAFLFPGTYRGVIESFMDHDDSDDIRVALEGMIIKPPPQEKELEIKYDSQEGIEQRLKKERKDELIRRLKKKNLPVFKTDKKADLISRLTARILKEIEGGDKTAGISHLLQEDKVVEMPEVVRNDSDGEEEEEEVFDPSSDEEGEEEEEEEFWNMDTGERIVTAVDEEELEKPKKKPSRKPKVIRDEVEGDRIYDDEELAARLDLLEESEETHKDRVAKGIKTWETEEWTPYGERIRQYKLPVGKNEHILKKTIYDTKRGYKTYKIGNSFPYTVVKPKKSKNPIGFQREFNRLREQIERNFHKIVKEVTGKSSKRDDNEYKTWWLDKIHQKHRYVRKLFDKEVNMITTDTDDVIQNILYGDAEREETEKYLEALTALRDALNNNTKKSKKPSTGTTTALKAVANFEKGKWAKNYLNNDYHKKTNRKVIEDLQKEIKNLPPYDEDEDEQSKAQKIVLQYENQQIFEHNFGILLYKLYSMTSRIRNKAFSAIRYRNSKEQEWFANSIVLPMSRLPENENEKMEVDMVDMVGIQNLLEALRAILAEDVTPFEEVGRTEINRLLDAYNPDGDYPLRELSRLITHIYHLYFLIGRQVIDGKEEIVLLAKQEKKEDTEKLIARHKNKSYIYKKTRDKIQDLISKYKEGPVYLYRLGDEDFSTPFMTKQGLIQEMMNKGPKSLLTVEVKELDFNQKIIDAILMVNNNEDVTDKFRAILDMIQDIEEDIKETQNDRLLRLVERHASVPKPDRLPPAFEPRKIEEDGKIRAPRQEMINKYIGDEFKRNLYSYNSPELVKLTDPNPLLDQIYARNPTVEDAGLFSVLFDHLFLSGYQPSIFHDNLFSGRLPLTEPVKDLFPAGLKQKGVWAKIRKEAKERALNLVDPTRRIDFESRTTVDKNICSNPQDIENVVRGDVVIYFDKAEDKKDHKFYCFDARVLEDNLDRGNPHTGRPFSPEFKNKMTQRFQRLEELRHAILEILTKPVVDDNDLNILKAEWETLHTSFNRYALEEFYNKVKYDLERRTTVKDISSILESGEAIRDLAKIKRYMTSLRSGKDKVELTDEEVIQKYQLESGIAPFLLLNIDKRVKEHIDLELVSEKDIEHGFTAAKSRGKGKSILRTKISLEEAKTLLKLLSEHVRRPVDRGGSSHI